MHAKFQGGDKDERLDQDSTNEVCGLYKNALMSSAVQAKNVAYCLELVKNILAQKLETDSAPAAVGVRDKKRKRSSSEAGPDKRQAVEKDIWNHDNRMLEPHTAVERELFE